MYLQYQVKSYEFPQFREVLAIEKNKPLAVSLAYEGFVSNALFY